MVDVINLFFWGGEIWKIYVYHLAQTATIGHFKSNKQFLSIVLLKNSVNSFHIFVQVWTLEQTLFNFLNSGKSRFPPNQLQYDHYLSLWERAEFSVLHRNGQILRLL